MTAWLTDTLVYSGALIALVLVLRRPVGRYFGPQTAYALWALPGLRFLLPPIVLPAAFAPEPAMEMLPLAAATAGPGEAAWLPDHSVPAANGWDWQQAALIIWLAGAAIFLAWRGWTYLRMREELLAGARPVGEVGRVRLVEAPAVVAPVAFGVSDKVVALPMEFMAREDRAARDLAIEHELAHHRGRDLLANILAQPVLALHWFNPLAWLGWRAMRRDQEAACDARVMACRAPAERAAYGQVIASFAAGSRLALAAPMACPVLGEKSIIHRLRSLGRPEVSPRRRLAGHALLAGAALAVPLTASISYAETEAPAVPQALPLPSEAAVGPMESEQQAQSAEQEESGSVASEASFSGESARQGAERSEILPERTEQPNRVSPADANGGVYLAVAGVPAVPQVPAPLRPPAAPLPPQAPAAPAIPLVTLRCGSGEGQQLVTARADEIGERMSACQREVRRQAMISARDALTRSRQSIARNRDILAEAREEVLSALDEQIAELSADY